MHLLLYYKAFNVLSRFRQPGNGQGSIAKIAFREIVSYADEYKIFDEDQRDRLIMYMSEMDDALISYHNRGSEPDWKRESPDTKPKL